MDSFHKRPLLSPFNDELGEPKNFNQECITDDDEEDRDTVPDEEFGKMTKIGLRGKLTSWPNNKDQRADPGNLKIEGEGPNINLKLPKRSYSSKEEKNYFYNKIKSKQKTELCKNWSLYSDCYFKDNCSFAHGEKELRQVLVSTEKYKTKVCKMFNEDFYCNYGNRCIYLHIIKERRLFNYKHILRKTVEELSIEISKGENEKKDFLKIVNTLKQKKQYKTPRLAVFIEICKS